MALLLLPGLWEGHFGNLWGSETEWRVKKTHQPTWTQGPWPLKGRKQDFRAGESLWGPDRTLSVTGEDTGTSPVLRSRPSSSMFLSTLSGTPQPFDQGPHLLFATSAPSSTFPPKSLEAASRTFLTPHVCRNSWEHAGPAEWQPRCSVSTSAALSCASLVLG